MPATNKPSRQPVILFATFIAMEANAVAVMATVSIETVVNTTAIIEQSDLRVIQSESEVACGVFTLVTYVFVFGSMCLFGLIGNSLSFAVMQMDRRIHVAAFLLQVMAVTDNAFLITTGFSQIFTALLIYVGRVDHPIMPYMYKYIHPLVHITQLGTVWITVLVAFNRYIAICRPFRAPLLCTMNRVRLQVIVMFILIILYNVPRFCEYRIEYVVEADTNWTQPRSEVTDLKKSETYNIVYENALYCLFVFLGPLAILVVLNSSLIRELVLAHRRQLARQLPRVKGEEQEQNITLVMVIVIIVFLVCQTPAYINQVLSYVLGEEAYHCGKPYYYYFHVSNLVVSANSVFNFVIYCVFRKQFRQRLSTFWSRRGLTSHSTFSSSATYHQTRCPGNSSISRHQANTSSIISDSISKSQPFQSLTSI